MKRLLHRRAAARTSRSIGTRRSRIERLETRNLLAADITSVSIEVNDLPVFVDQSNSTVHIAAGDKLEVVGIDYEITGDTQGLAAFEGYVRQGDTTDAVAYDYGDGRFGATDRDSPMAPGSLSHAGLDGSWQLKQFADRLTVALVRYQNGAATVEDRFHVKLATGSPDFTIDSPSEASAFQVGQEARIIGQWTNDGTGTYETYIEVDIFSCADKSQPIWVGTLSGIAGDGDSIAGEVLNNKDTDAYSARWTPAQAGKYLMLVEVDPEDLIDESDEDDNKIWLEVSVFGRSIVGTQKDDKIMGTNRPDSIFGLGGDDVIEGRNGGDQIDGGSGDDKLRGGNGMDVMSGGLDNDKLWGGNDNDRLFGGEGEDELRGDHGNDFLVGGVGDDKLRGGKGRDIFFFEAGSGSDEIEDFKRGEDKIHIMDYFTDFLSLLAASKDDVINLSPKDRLILKNIKVDDLVASDFVFGSDSP